MSDNTLILNGQTVADYMKEETGAKVKELKERGIQPCLATILVGDDPSSATYVRMKGNACARIGVESIKVVLPAETTTEELIQEINKLNQDPSVHGILLQHPVPHHIDERACFDTISIEKDVDGVTTLGYALNAFGEADYPSCTPQAIIRILDFYNIPLEGKHAVVIGRSPILGKPVSAMLLNRNATVTTCHSRTVNIEEIVKQADIVVAAVGKPNFVQGDWIKPGAVVVDAGYNKGNIGDVDYDACLPHSSAITPVPGGVGPVTIATLIEHTVKSAYKLLLK
ncbi:tetrahydrofolate dehydrogenase/cyclohydrolase catalytic domain-containing protein [Paenibacillus sp. 453mf]|uniref:bifunctional 5,10-methylenetetrahydrofolate dehydrogenase/5,10-methenyltetrahydrofolate cyclohydrolase n=1 Tax=Paenibacillus sp. 453mf TaxID=1761874 RepID=UPI0008E85E54|nr:tetrahydrofolate dehydrogenase/cyclohydrolase catalytic domain-containing protein [Paenibacillus sp. 453mf]SFS36707.1 methylenetetrahydrofolate dehydrogenase (NADP+) / methenyltetrahydrofolate cyclohydrolase [Paenibacillus sp. 453mf]